VRRGQIARGPPLHGDQLRLKTSGGKPHFVSCHVSGAKLRESSRGSLGWTVTRVVCASAIELFAFIARLATWLISRQPCLSLSGSGACTDETFFGGIDIQARTAPPLNSSVRIPRQSEAISKTHSPVSALNIDECH
jgi:hypothetical protein